MSENARLPESPEADAGTSRTESDAERRHRYRRELQEYEAFVADALAHHARTGEWPPDPILDEVAEMRRSIMAEHDNDYDKVLDWYVELGKQRANGSTDSPGAVADELSASASGS